MSGLFRHWQVGDKPSSTFCRSVSSAAFRSVIFCIRLTNPIIISWHNHRCAYAYLIMLSSCHSSTLQPRPPSSSSSFSFLSLSVSLHSLDFFHSSRVWMSLTLTVVQYERSTVRLARHFFCFSYSRGSGEQIYKRPKARVYCSTRALVLLVIISTNY